jgi:hypothetical protein
MTPMDEMVAMQAAAKALRDRAPLITSLLAIPYDAERPEVLTKEDGSTVIRWFEPCCDDDSHADFWWVTQSADRRTVDVDHFTSEPSFTDRVLDTLKYVLQYQTGVNVNYCNQITP